MVSEIRADTQCLVLHRSIWRAEYLIPDIVDITEKVVRASEVRRHLVSSRSCHMEHDTTKLEAFMEGLRVYSCFLCRVA